MTWQKPPTCSWETPVTCPRKRNCQTIFEASENRGLGGGGVGCSKNMDERNFWGVCQGEPLFRGPPMSFPRTKKISVNGEALLFRPLREYLSLLFGFIGFRIRVWGLGFVVCEPLWPQKLIPSTLRQMHYKPQTVNLK